MPRNHPAMDLMELIRATKGDRSYADLERAGGGSPSAKRWQQLATKPQANFPDPPTIRAMARALGVSESSVIVAAGRSLGLTLDAPEGPLVDLLPPGAKKLTHHQVSAVLAVIRAMLEPADAPAKTRGDEVPLPPIHDVPTETPGLRMISAAYSMNADIARELEVIAKRAIAEERGNNPQQAQG